MERLRYIVWVLAGPPERQETYVQQWGGSYDELALELDDVFPVVRADLAAAQADAVDRVLSAFGPMNGRARFWTSEALREASEWDAVRSAARAALTALG